MITIHNSSLVFNRAGYIKPEQVSLDKKQAQPLAVTNDQHEKNQGLPVSTPEQVQAAIAQVGLTKDDNFSQENDRPTNKALQAYNQTRNQPNQIQLENILPRVDYYA